jgi:hypothetical protein
MPFYCNHNKDHTNKQVMYIDRIFDENDNPHDVMLIILNGKILRLLTAKLKMHILD